MNIRVISVLLVCVVVIAGAYAQYQNEAAPVSGSSSCGAGTFAEVYSCWRDALKERIGNDDIPGALNLLVEASSKSPEFMPVCHSFAHEIGERAYDDFLAGRIPAISRDMQACDFGFYHGFMTKFLAHSGNLKEVGAFCTSMREGASQGVMNESRNACFHGIGHGSVADHDVAAWKDPLPILKRSVAVCRGSAATAEDFFRCAGGIYNGVAYSPFQTLIDPQDPLKICRQVGPEDSPQNCYSNLASIVFNLTPHKTIAEAVALARVSASAEHVPLMISTFANMAARQIGSEQVSSAACQALSGQERELCFSGYVVGLVQGEVPDRKERKAFAYCSSSFVRDSERGDCFIYAFDQLRDFWTTDRIQASCERAPDSGREACLDALEQWTLRRFVRAT